VSWEVMLCEKYAGFWQGVVSKKSAEEAHFPII
jgi:hypothetical protein